MPSPFPGMDPFLEGSLWADVHQELSSVIRLQLLRQISPKYIAAINTYTAKDEGFKEDVGIMYPDVGILPSGREPDSPTSVISTQTISHPILEFEELMTPNINIPFIEIRDQQSRVLITCIELISPANKRNPTFEDYKRKRQSMVDSRVHFLEIDLIRRGKRIFHHPKTPKKDYQATLFRANLRRTQIWTFDLEDPLPVLPVPLRDPDPDAILNLREALDTAYERGMYHLSINYAEEPPPPDMENKEKLAWLKKKMKEGEKRNQIE